MNNNSIKDLYENKQIDSYIRKNPRKNVKCSPLLWGDNKDMYFQEHFANINNNNNNNNNLGRKIIRNNDKYEDNFYYLQDNLKNIKVRNEKYNKACNKEKIVNKTKPDIPLLKMYDLDSRMLMKKQILGDIKEVNNIHDKIDKMNYVSINNRNCNNSIKNLNYTRNFYPEINNYIKSNLDHDFFKGQYNKDYFLPVNRVCRKKYDLEKHF